MKHRERPNGFSIGHWRHLYDACIHNREELAAVAAQNATFVVFDAEPWAEDNYKAAEIGISMLRVPESLHNLPTNTLPTTLSEFSEFSQIETHRIVFSDMNRSARREGHRFGQEHHICSIDAQDFIISLVDSYRHRHHNDKKARASGSEQVVFAGFDLHFELRLLSTTHTRLTDYFTSWLDIQELACLSSDIQKPGLSETLRACGFGRQNAADLHSLCGRHNAATDTVRAAAILQHLFVRESVEPLHIATSARNASILARKRRGLPANAPEDRQLWIGCRPKPPELYPYAARMRRSTGDVLVAEALRDMFAEWEPVAVGVAKQTRHWYGWVCLPSRGALDRFVEAVDGAEHPGGGTWMAVSCYDPDVMPAKDRRELGERLHAMADEKRQQRRLKRLANEMENPF
ncbi:Ribonuclease H [Cordyceps militaris]|uniref:Ribonuclease H n=1 Tax=Cordyceps militaris TaxID=73501 RepID=A0A2H4S711_CORMI|nr:Ribonuclease H [Cordyceps militaris]